MHWYIFKFKLEFVTWYVVEEPIYGGYMALTVFKETLINFPVVLISLNVEK
jgi:hypothetical protein